MKVFSFFLLCGILVSSCNTSKKIQTTKLDELVHVKSMMTGSFSSTAQALADSNYYDITLHMYPIWEKREGNWLYVEQAVTQNQSKPYRQRIYKLEQLAEGSFVSLVYTLDDPSKYVGKWKTPEFFNSLDGSIISEKVGCGVFLKKQNDGSYKGSTDGKNCFSKLRGASYATSVVTVKNGSIKSWDQGFDDKDEQVWGATLGGYIFNKN